MRFVRAFSPAIVAAGLLGAAAPALAHPHVFVAVKSTLVFAADGVVTGVRHSWTFDDMYSAFATQGLSEQDGAPLADGLKALAKVNVEQLAEAEFFTVVKAGGKRAEFAAATDYDISLDEKKIVTLHFTAPLKQPVSARKALVLQVFDPTYFVAFDFEKTAPVALEGAPPGCSVSVAQAPKLSDEDARALSDSAGTNDSPGVNFGIKLAGRAVVACP